MRDFLAIHLLEDGLTRLLALLLIRFAERDDFRDHRIGERSLRCERGAADHDLVDILLADRREFLFVEDRVSREEDFLRLRIEHVGAEQTAHEAVVEQLEGIECRGRQACARWTRFSVETSQSSSRTMTSCATSTRRRVR